MTRSDGEQEFVLGNKQILSAFFVVAALLGVFFVMGYIVGRNSGDSSKKTPAQTEPVPSTAANPVPDSAAAPGSVPSSIASPPMSASPAPTETAPAQTTTSPAPTEAPKPVEKAEEKAPAPEKPSEKAAMKVESGPGHSYLQVSAVKRPAADSVVQTLKDKGFPALLSESSKPGLFRVLVGPYATTEALGKAKTDLKGMGFDAVVSK